MEFGKEEKEGILSMLVRAMYITYIIYTLVESFRPVGNPTPQLVVCVS
jgi:hypothetical protein